MIRPTTINVRTTVLKRTELKGDVMVLKTKAVKLVMLRTYLDLKTASVAIMSIVRGELSLTLGLNTGEIVGKGRRGAIRMLHSRRLCKSRKMRLMFRYTKTMFATRRTIRVMDHNKGVVVINARSGLIPVGFLGVGQRIAVRASFHCYGGCPRAVRTFTAKGFGMGSVIARMCSCGSIRGTFRRTVSPIGGYSVVGNMMGMTRWWF